MRKRFFGLLLAFSLAACLLPVKAFAAVSASVILAGNTLEITKYDTPAYYANPKSEQTDGKPTTPNAENWNAKLVWDTGKDIPTLYLKGFAVDDAKQTGIGIPAGQPMRIVITQDSHINAQFGIVYKSDLEIISENSAKLTANCLSGAITSGAATGCKLTIDANLNLSVKTYYDASSHILQTNKADLTINGGNIKVSTDDEKSLFGIVTRHSGNIIINGGKLDVTSSIGASPANGSIHASDKLIINGGTVKATAKAATPLYAKKGIEITGGLVEITAPSYGISAGTVGTPADIAIQGGTVKIAAKRAFFTYPVLGEGVFAYAGADEASAKVYDGFYTPLAKEPWMLLSNDPKLQRETEPTQAPTSATTVVTSAPPTEAPTATPTEAPTTVPTKAPTEVPGTRTALTRFLPWLAVAGAVGLIGIVITLIFFKRKKI